MSVAAPVAIVDDHELLVAALGLALEAEGHEVLRPRVESLEGLLAGLLRRPPRVVLLDLDLGGAGDGGDIVAALARSGSRVIVVSATTEHWRVGRCLELGAVGWLAKSASIERFLAAVRAGAEGGDVICAAERMRLLEAWRDHRVAEAHRLRGFARLTPREEHVLGALMDGRHVDQIAADDVVSPATVRTHVRSLLLKLGVNSQLEAVALANRARWRPRGAGAALVAAPAAGR